MSNFFGLLFISIALIISDCAERKKEVRKIELQFALGAYPPGLKVAREIIQLFEQEYPDIRVKLISIPGDYVSKMITMVSSNLAIVRKKM